MKKQYITKADLEAEKERLEARIREEKIMYVRTSLDGSLMTVKKFLAELE